MRHHRFALAALAAATLAAAPAAAQPRPSWDVYISRVETNIRWNPTIRDYEVTLGYQVCATSLVSGDTRSVSFDVDVYLDRVTAPACGERGADATIPTTLKLGSCASVSGTFSGVPTGTYRTWAFADARCAITETSERNNAKYGVWSVGKGKVDLTVSSFNATVSGSTVTFRGIICNKGGATRDYTAGLYLGPSTAISCRAASLAEAVINIPANLCQTVTAVFPGVPPGRYSVALGVDTGCQVPESNEGNNARADTFSVALACRTNGDCLAKEYCRFTTTCGGSGTCVRRPDACITVYDPVCGCDGKTYSNACVAASRGANVRAKGACKGP